MHYVKDYKSIISLAYSEEHIYKQYHRDVVNIIIKLTVYE